MNTKYKQELTTTDLLNRYWTRTLIKRFLPLPDGRINVEHWANYRGQDIYTSTRAWNIELSEEFGAAFLKTWNGRHKKRMEGKLPEDCLTEIRKYSKNELGKLR
jgi:hypothetical protein